jgi:hypothetical protein
MAPKDFCAMSVTPIRREKAAALAQKGFADDQTIDRLGRGPPPWRKFYKNLAATHRKARRQEAPQSTALSHGISVDLVATSIEHSWALACSCNVSQSDLVATATSVFIF